MHAFQFFIFRLVSFIFQIFNAMDFDCCISFYYHFEFSLPYIAFMKILYSKINLAICMHVTGTILYLKFSFNIRIVHEFL